MKMTPEQQLFLVQNRHIIPLEERGGYLLCTDAHTDNDGRRYGPYILTPEGHLPGFDDFYAGDVQNYLIDTLRLGDRIVVKSPFSESLYDITILAINKERRQIEGVYNCRVDDHVELTEIIVDTTVDKILVFNHRS